MQIFVVGGAVRDELLGRPSDDRDYVVVGASPQAMLARGFRPVGRDFPVFLHPRTHEEYALARTERKSGHGYHGFSFHADPDVTLEEDLGRRDLTINAIARAADGTLIDPFHGQHDISAKILRHVGPAFAEDPVRILRLARFAARFTDFSIAPETLALMQQMVAVGEVDHLVPERVWQELAKGLMEVRPSRMIEVLRDCGALPRLLPEVDALFGVPQRADYHPEIDTGIHTLMVIDQAAANGLALPGRFAALTHDLGKALTPADILPRHLGHELRSVEQVEILSERLRVPAECRDLALLMARYHGNIHRAADLRSGTIVELFEKTDALRRPERFRMLLESCRCDYNGRLGWTERDYFPQTLLNAALAAVNAVDAGTIARNCKERSDIPARVHAARVAAVRAALNQPGDEPENQ
ncbi:multifunctional CCA addition/repair protein [Dechloromonas sp.]|uniref:multifunctional CCA addition/repair protein n=1 Tax=Dechloromonas sp. TaxID=1917218 RepID=UPI00121E85BB|nr:multifunctional CCA addition/repair protein [Dechloromonas sp.]MBU3695154.1 multifunctional CCA addition/repair protein [Dechloromonas sp.]TEX47773.1 MAG: multifunctional CCA tRNA nucleotidyl transferase/2'3'-cyclic phosphodiesterase/2'nucleotidase/phosphatase [Rhodocyclaceae bacterium]